MYVAELVQALATRFPGDRLELYGHRWRSAPAAPPPPPASARLHRRRLPAPVMAAARRVGLGADRVLGGVDVMHWTDYVPLETSRAPVVATVHDVCFEELPDCYADAQRVRLRAVTERIAAVAARILVPCARVRRALVERFDVDAGRVRVVPHGLRWLPSVTPAAEGPPYVLVVGTLQPRKNLARLLVAFDCVHARHPETRLVVAGGRGWHDDELVAGLASRAHVRWEEHVGPERLARLYAGARCVATPSLGEGFGLPVLEAMAAGRPLLVGEDTACSDLAEDAALAVEPRSQEALADALLRLLEDDALCARLAAAGRARAAGFTWARCAAATRAVYAEALGS